MLSASGPLFLQDGLYAPVFFVRTPCCFEVIDLNHEWLPHFHDRSSRMCTRICIHHGDLQRHAPLEQFNVSAQDP